VLRCMYDIYKSSTNFEGINEVTSKDELTMELLLSLVFHYFHFSNQINSEIRFNNSEQLIFKYRNHTDYGFVLQNFSFELLLKRISPANILRIVCALLLERKVALLFQNYQQNAVIMESIISLISPLYYFLLKH